MDLERPEIDIPFSVRVYENGFLGLAYHTYVHGVDIVVHGTLAHPENLTLYKDGKVRTSKVTYHKLKWLKL